MKRVLIAFIEFYQHFVSPILTEVLNINCRYSQTCSEYAKEAIGKHGVLQGGLLATKRILSCQPFKKYEYT